MATPLRKLTVCASVRFVAKSVCTLGLALWFSWILAACGGGGGAANSPAPPASLNYVAGPTLTSGIGHPKGVVVADFNGDGKPDIAVSNFDTNTIAVFLNDGSGNFSAPIVTNVQLNSSLGLNVGSLAVGDFNEDGKPDLVVATIAGGQVSIVLLGNGDGTFSQQPPIPNSFGFLRAEVADLNGDGHQDLVFALDGSLAVSLGKGDGTFGAMTTLPSASYPGLYFGLSVADFNGDGKLDIAATDFGSGTGGFGSLVFYSGNGDGTFANPTAVTLSIASFPGSLASGDFNGDGKRDVLIGFPNAAFIAFGNGDGTFNLALNSLEFVYSGNSQTPTTNSVTVLATKLTKDGKFDAVTSDFDTGTLQIAMNSALGKTPPNPGIFSFALAPGLADIAAGDLNGDGVLDVVVLNYRTSKITVVLSE
jgi:FG-GAP-like repeat